MPIILINPIYAGFKFSELLWIPVLFVGGLLLGYMIVFIRAKTTAKDYAGKVCPECDGEKLLLEKKCANCRAKEMGKPPPPPREASFTVKGKGVSFKATCDICGGKLYTGICEDCYPIKLADSCLGTGIMAVILMWIAVPVGIVATITTADMMGIIAGALFGLAGFVYALIQFKKSHKAAKKGGYDYYPKLAACFGFLFPGMGQFYIGKQELGIAILIVFIVSCIISFFMPLAFLVSVIIVVVSAISAYSTAANMYSLKKKRSNNNSIG